MFLLCSTFSMSAAQVGDMPDEPKRYSMALVGVPLSIALPHLVEKTRIDLFYENEMVAGQMVYCNGEQLWPEELLTCILKASNLDFYRLSSGLYVITKRPESAPEYGSLTGLVFDSRTQEPLADASIILQQADMGVASNHSGRFAFARLLPGWHEVVVTHVAYQDKMDSIWVAPFSNSQVEVSLTPRIVSTEPIVIQGMEYRLPSKELAVSGLQYTDVQDRAVTATPSVHQAINSVLGVQASEALANLHIQGGDAGEHQYLLDGVPVFVPIRNAGFFSVLSPSALERIAIHKAGFEARYGSYLSGSIEMEHALSSQDSSHTALQFDPLSLSGRINGGLDLQKNRTATWMMAGRLSLWNVFQPAPLSSRFEEWGEPDHFIQEALASGDRVEDSSTSRLSSPLDLSFSDIHAAFRVQYASARSLSASLYVGRNQFGTDVFSPEQSDESIYSWSNAMYQVRYEWVHGHRAFMQVGVWGSTYNMQHPIDRLPLAALEPGLLDSVGVGTDFNDILDRGIYFGFDLAASERQTLSGKLEVIATESEFSLSIDPLGRTPVVDATLVQPVRWRFQAYLEDAISLSQRTNLTLGSRFTYLPGQERLYAEPRVAVRHDFPGGPGGSWAVRVAAGLYRQFINQYDVASYNATTIFPRFRFWIPLGKGIRAPAAYHLAGSILYLPNPSLKTRLEAFYKYIPQTAVLNYTNRLPSTSDGLSTPFQYARAYSYGVGASLRYDFESSFLEGNYQYVLSGRRMPGRFDHQYMPVPWETPHQAHVLVGFSPFRGVSTFLRWEGHWGRKWGYRKAYYDYLEPDAAAIGQVNVQFLSQPDMHTLTPFLKLDAGVSYGRTLKDVYLEAGLFLLNVMDRANEIEWVIENNEGVLENQPRYATPFYPSVSLRVRY